MSRDRKHQVDMARDKVLQRRARPAIRDMRQIGPGDDLEQFSREMMRRAVSRRPFFERERPNVKPELSKCRPAPEHFIATRNRLDRGRAPLHSIWRFKSNGGSHA
jgi:hypothetical protein